MSIVAEFIHYHKVIQAKVGDKIKYRPFLFVKLDIAKVVRNEKYKYIKANLISKFSLVRKDYRV